MPYLPTVNVRGLCPRAGLNEKDPAVSQVPEDIHWSREAIHSRIFLAQNLGLSHCAVNQSCGCRVGTRRNRSASCSSRSFPS